MVGGKIIFLFLINSMTKGRTGAKEAEHRRFLDIRPFYSIGKEFRNRMLKAVGHLKYITILFRPFCNLLKTCLSTKYDLFNVSVAVMSSWGLSAL